MEEACIDDPELEDRLEMACCSLLSCLTTQGGVFLDPRFDSKSCTNSSRLICIHLGLLEPMLSIMTDRLADSLIMASTPRDMRHSCLKVGGEQTRDWVSIHVLSNKAVV